MREMGRPPVDYSELFQQYYRYLSSLASKFGIVPCNVEDAVSRVIVRAIECDLLATYNPRRLFPHKDGYHRAQFRTFLRAFASPYLLSYRREQDLRRRREVRLATSDEEEIEYYLGDHENGVEAVIDEADGDALINAIQEELIYVQAGRIYVPARQRGPRCDLVALFEEIVRQIRLDGEHSAVELQGIFGVSESTIYSWLLYLATVIHKLLPDLRTRNL